jgi:hypothetical protein
MGIFNKFAAMVLGSKEEQLIKAKKEIAYSVTRSRHPKEAEAVEVFVNGQYELALEKILYTIGNTLRHHAKLTDADHIQNSAFMERFIEDYGYHYFRNGVSLGHQTQAGTADRKFQADIGILMEGLHKRMMADANNSFSSPKIAECFSAGAKAAADAGFETGVQAYQKTYIIKQ